MDTFSPTPSTSTFSVRKMILVLHTRELNQKLFFDGFFFNFLYWKFEPIPFFFDRENDPFYRSKNLFAAKIS